MRKTGGSVTLIATAAAVLGLAYGPGAQAQESGAANYAGGRSAATSKECPTIEWHILPTPPNRASNVNGVAYYTDMSGISVIKGTIAADGTVALTLTSVSGNGPAGVVTGRRDTTGTRVELRGAGCSNAKINFSRWPQTGGGGN